MKRRLIVFDFKKKRKNKTPLISSKTQTAQKQTSPSLSNQNTIAQRNKIEASNEIEKTTQIIHEDVASAVATLRAWLNQDKLH
jgi:hypothetical protein